MSNNPFKVAESGSSESKKPEQPSVESERLEELRKRVEEVESQRGGEEIEELRGRVEEIESEAEEEEPPEPDRPCTGEGCEGFAVEEIEPEHVTTQKTIGGDNNRPKRVECPRCGEEMGTAEIVPKEEQKSNLHGGTPLFANDAAAGGTLREDFEQAGREDVLEEAESRWSG